MLGSFSSLSLTRAQTLTQGLAGKTSGSTDMCVSVLTFSPSYKTSEKRPDFSARLKAAGLCHDNRCWNTTHTHSLTHTHSSPPHYCSSLRGSLSVLACLTFTPALKEVGGKEDGMLGCRDGGMMRGKCRNERGTAAEVVREERRVAVRNLDTRTKMEEINAAYSYTALWASGEFETEGEKAREREREGGGFVFHLGNLSLICCSLNVCSATFIHANLDLFRLPSILSPRQPGSYALLTRMLSTSRGSNLPFFFFFFFSFPLSVSSHLRLLLLSFRFHLPPFSSCPSLPLQLRLYLTPSSTFYYFVFLLSLLLSTLPFPFFLLEVFYSSTTVNHSSAWLFRGKQQWFIQTHFTSRAPYCSPLSSWQHAAYTCINIHAAAWSLYSPKFEPC